MKPAKCTSKIALLLAALTCIGLPAIASAVLISGVGGAPSWPGWVGGAIQDFDSGPVGLFAGPLTLGNTTFQGLDGPLDISPAYIGQYNSNGVNSLQSGIITDPIKPTKIEFKFNLPVEAVAFNWGAADDIWLMSAYDTSNVLIESHLIALPYAGVNNGEYFGIQASGIKRLLLADQLNNGPGGDHIFIDDFTTTSEALPEPSALAIAALSVCVASRARRRRTMCPHASSS